MDIFVAGGELSPGEYRYSGSYTNDEQTTWINPPAGTYTVIVVPFVTPGGPAKVKLYTYVLGTTDAHNVIVTAPATVATAAKGTVGLTFVGLDPAQRYLGQLVYSGAADFSGVEPTIITVSP